MSENTPITVELRAALDVDREFMRADGAVVAQTFCVDRGDFERCCDAIDAVHAGLERENAELRERVAVLDKRSESMHDGWVRLPVDADGETIHVGDVMENTVCPSVHREVTGVGVECFYGWDDGNGRYAQFDANCYRHHSTVEDVLTEFGIDWEYESDCEDRAALLKEYAAKLRLAGSDAE